MTGACPACKQERLAQGECCKQYISRLHSRIGRLEELLARPAGPARERFARRAGDEFKGLVIETGE